MTVLRGYSWLRSQGFISSGVWGEMGAGDSGQASSHVSMSLTGTQSVLQGTGRESKNSLRTVPRHRDDCMIRRSERKGWQLLYSTRLMRKRAHSPEEHKPAFQAQSFVPKLFPHGLHFLKNINMQRDSTELEDGLVSIQSWLESLSPRMIP